MTIQKPQFLYHASPNRNIEEFQPRAETVRHPDEGPVIFAKADKAAVSVFLVPSNDTWTSSGAFSDGKETVFRYMVISDEKRYRDADAGGAIYTLPSETFYFDDRYNPSAKEWVSKVPVKPVAKEEYDSGIDAMLQAGVQVYFVDTETFRKIQSAEDHGFEILKTLTSENQEQGINVQLLDF